MHKCTGTPTHPPTPTRANLLNAQEHKGRHHDDGDGGVVGRPDQLEGEGEEVDKDRLLEVNRVSERNRSILDALKAGQVVDQGGEGRDQDDVGIVVDDAWACVVRGAWYGML